MPNEVFIYLFDDKPEIEEGIYSRIGCEMMNIKYLDSCDRFLKGRYFKSIDVSKGNIWIYDFTMGDCNKTSTDVFWEVMRKARDCGVEKEVIDNSIILVGEDVYDTICGIAEEKLTAEQKSLLLYLKELEKFKRSDGSFVYEKYVNKISTIEKFLAKKFKERNIEFDFLNPNSNEIRSDFLKKGLFSLEEIKAICAFCRLEQKRLIDIEKISNMSKNEYILYTNIKRTYHGLAEFAHSTLQNLDYMALLIENEKSCTNDNGELNEFWNQIKQCLAEIEGLIKITNAEDALRIKGIKEIKTGNEKEAEAQKKVEELWGNIKTGIDNPENTRLIKELEEPFNQ